MAFGKRNVIKIDPLSYSLCLLGESKAGKTTLIYEYCQKLTNSDDGYLFFEIGSEHGADAISGINYINTPRWNMDYDEYSNSAGFADVCDDIIENKSESYPNLKVVVWDTYDQLITIAEAESIRLYNKEARATGKETAKSINSAWGGFNRGEKKAMELMFNYKNKLLEVGVQVIVIGHVKKKDVNDVVTGEQYQILTSDQQQNYFNALKKDMHFLALLYIDREIVKESTGKKDIKGRDIKVNKLMSESRRIKFRDDNYAVDSGSRFAEIVPEVPCDVDMFVDAITNAIKAEASKGDKSVEDLKKEQDAAYEERKNEISIQEEKNKKERDLKTVIEHITTYCKENKTDKTKLLSLAQKAKELGYESPISVTNIDDANAILELCV